MSAPVLVAALLSCCMLQADAHTDITDDEILAWFETTWRAEPVFDELHDMECRYRLLLPSPLTGAELASARRAVEGRPDHPLRMVIPVAERRLAEGPDEFAYRAFLGPRGACRLVEDLDSSAATERNDLAVNGPTLWMMTPSQIAVMDQASPPRSRDIRPELRLARIRLQFSVTGGMHTAEHSLLSVKGIRAGADGWWVTTSSDDGEYQVDYLVGWHENAERPVIRERVYTSIEKGLQSDYLGRRMTFSDWRLDAEIDQWRAHRIEEFDPQGRLIEELVFGPTRPIDRAEMESVLIVPSIGGEDAIRGDLSAVSAIDYRGGRRIRQELAEDGSITVIDLGSTPVQAAGAALQRFAWFSIGAVLLVVSGYAASRNAGLKARVLSMIGVARTFTIQKG